MGGGEASWLDYDKVGQPYICLKLAKLVGQKGTNRGDMFLKSF